MKRTPATIEELRALPIDAPVYVRILSKDGESVVRRHFAGLCDTRPMVWAAGGTAWSSGVTVLCDIVYLPEDYELPV